MYIYNKKYKIGPNILYLRSNKNFKTELITDAPFPNGCTGNEITVSCHFVDNKEFIKQLSFNQDKHINNIYSQVYFSKDENYFIIKDYKNKTCEFFTTNEYYYEDKTLYPIEEKIRANLSHLFGQLSIGYNTILLHGSGIIRENMSYIFLARDGGGKTTLINKNKKFQILSDDQICYSIQDRKVFAHSSPFGTFPVDDLFAPIRAFFVIVKSNEFSLRQGDNKQLIASFWQDNLEMLVSLPKNIRKHSFQLLSSISLSAPAFELKANHGDLDWDQIDFFLKNTK